MRRFLHIIKGLSVMALVVFLYAFSSSRNMDQPISDVKINFVGESPLYLSSSSVDKLLIQNQASIECLSKEVLDLKGLEDKLSSHQMVQNAEAYLTVDGEVRLEIEQRKPIARVVSEPSFYIDSYGKMMPLSAEHSARVLLVHGHLDKESMQLVFELIKAIKEDRFLNSNVTDILIDAESKLSMRMRACDFDIVIGSKKDLKQKFMKLKAFYQKAKRDKMLGEYKKVNLQYNQQVVCTKK